MCKSRLESQISHDKLLSIVGAVPDIISVISCDSEILFVNAGLENNIKAKNIIEYLSESKYHRRYIKNSDQTSSILQDIKTSFALDIGIKVDFGITEFGNELIEWNGRLII